MERIEDPELMTIQWVQQCTSCRGTGLYVGMTERDGSAVVCGTCKGTGREVCKHNYKEFKGREERIDVRQVYAACAGTILAPDVVPGGVSYENWKQNPNTVFALGRETRFHSCPAWWYQSVDYKQKPNWDECNEAIGKTFSDCPHFSEKAKCWDRFDREAREKAAA